MAIPKSSFGRLKSNFGCRRRFSTGSAAATAQAQRCHLGLPLHTNPRPVHFTLLFSLLHFALLFIDFAEAFFFRSISISLFPLFEFPLDLEMDTHVNVMVVHVAENN